MTEPAENQNTPEDFIMGEESEFTEISDAAPDLQAELDAMKLEVAKYKDAMLRTMADAENVRKRAERDVQETAKYAAGGFARDIVGAVDNLYRALESVSDEDAQSNSKLANIRTGVDMTLKEMMSALEKNGVRRIFPLGEKFDHNLHQAMQQVDDAAVEPGTVVQVYQAGYVVHDRLLRPAMVVVSKMPAAQQGIDTAA